MTERQETVLQFNDNGFCAILYGPHHRHLAQIEAKLPVSLSPIGNELTIEGETAEVANAEEILKSLYALAAKGEIVDSHTIDLALRMQQEDLHPKEDEEVTFRTERGEIRARTPAQLHYLKLLNAKHLIFGLGPAGTGKTYLAVAAGVSMMRQRKVDRLILSRPAVEAGEKIGFLPGDLKDKVDPYLRPLYDALSDMLPDNRLAHRIESNLIEIAPLAFMRGRTLANAFVILDEAQNTSPAQMKMFLTRLGDNSRMVITGDPTQVDLPPGQPSGLIDAVNRLGSIEEIGVARFTNKDVVRHPLVAKILDAYDRQQPSGKSHGPAKSN